MPRQCGFLVRATVAKERAVAEIGPGFFQQEQAFMNSSKFPIRFMALFVMTKLPMFGWMGFWVVSQLCLRGLTVGWFWRQRWARRRRFGDQTGEGEHGQNQNRKKGTLSGVHR